MAEKVKQAEPVTPAPVAEVPPKTEAQLLQEMAVATKSGDFKAVAKVATELVKFQKAKEQAEIDAKVKAVEAITSEVKATIESALKKLIDSGKLDKADGVWYSNDFGEKLTTCRLLKSVAKAPRASGGGGGGKKFATSTSDLMAKYGNQEYKDGKTFNAAWESNTDKNFRYAIREALLKLDGQIS